MDDNERDRYIIDTHSEVARIGALLEGYCKQSDSYEARIKTLEMKPARRWEDTVKTFITAVIGVVVGKFIK